MEDVTLGWIVTGVLVPAVVGLFTWLMKSQAARLEDQKYSNERMHEAMTIVADAARIISEKSDADARLQERIGEFMVRVEARLDQITDKLNNR